MTNPPTPRRCQRILQAHRLRCQGRSLNQIAAELGCARSTAAAYLRDFRIHHAHILQSVAEDQLLDQIQLLTEPDQEPRQHQQRVATARELRLLLTALPRIQADRQARPPQPPAPAPPPSAPPSPPPAHDQHFEDFLTEHYLDPNYPVLAGLVEPDPDPSPQNSPESGPIQTNLDKSGLPPDDSPVPGDEFVPPAQESRPQPKIGPQYPASWDNPYGYIYEPERDPLLQRMFGRR